MKKVLKLMLLMVMFSGSLFAEIVFNLDEQHFSKAIEGRYEVARYELPDSYVSTNLRYRNGYYFSNTDTGYFNVDIKEPIEEWSISFDLWFYQISQTRGIKLIDNSANAIIISFSSADIYFDSQKVVSSLTGSQRVIVGLSKNGDTIEISINGSKVGTTTRTDFSKLRYIETQLISDPYPDNLNSLTIGSK